MSYIQAYNPFWVNFCVWINSDPVSFFCMWVSNFPNIIYWRDYSFPIVYSWLLRHRLIDRICVDLFLGSLFCSIDLCVFFKANITLFITIALKHSLKSGNFISPFLFFLKFTLVIWDLLWFHANFRILFYFCEKCLWNFDRDCIKSVDCFG